MSTVNKKELLSEAYDAAIITASAIGVSMVAGMPLNKPAKLALPVGASSMLIKYGQEKKWIPNYPFKSA